MLFFSEQKQKIKESTDKILLKKKIILFLKKIPLARYANFIIIGIILFSSFNNKYWKQKDGIIHWDVISYYTYLPATFIYKDVTCKFLANPPKDYTGVIWASKTDNGSFVVMASMGMSILYSPFFFIAHALAKPLGYKPDGYTLPYSFAIAMGCIVYLLIGLYFLRKVLERFFSQWVIIITLFSIVICTNLVHHTLQQAGMSHVYNFSLFSIFLLLIIKWYEKPNYIFAFLIGILGGLISLIRPTNIIIFIIFILYGICSFKEFKQRFLFFFKSYKKILLMIIAFFIVWLPQFLYWKATTGQYIFYSYGKEHFFFTDPIIIRGLFGFRNGWLLYTPIMILAIIGLVFIKNKIRIFLLPITIFIILNIYIILSWWCWWYTGLGNRAFIDSYAILSVPLAAFVQFTLSNKNIFIKILFGFFIVVFNLFGIYHTLKYHYGSLHYCAMTKKAYWHSFGKIRPDNIYWQLLEEPDYEKAKMYRE